MSCIHQNAEVILEAFIARIRTAETFKEIKNVQIYQNTLYAQGDITKYRKVLEEIFKETYPALKNVEDIFIVEENTSSLALNISPEFSKVYEDIFTNKLLKEKAEYDKKGYKNGNFTIFKNIDTVPFLLAIDEFRALPGPSFRHSSGRVTKEFVRDYSSSPAALEKLKRKFGRSNVEYSKTFKDGMYVNKVQVFNPVLENYTSNKQLSLFLSPEVKEGVSELFETNPELSSIGTPEQYSEYLDTIFPKSKVKDIVYHAGRIGINKFDKKFIGFGVGIQKGGKGFYFADKKEDTSTYEEILNAKADDSQLYSVVLNIKNPELTEYTYQVKETIQGDKIFRSYGSPVKTIENVVNDKDSEQIRIVSPGYTSYSNPIGDYRTYEERVSTEFVVFEPEQIHILGSKEDIEGFREFVNKPNQKSSSITNGDIKPGVEELFESNPELANEVYEALGFRQNDNYTHVVLDESGDVQEVYRGTFEGANKYIQKNDPNQYATRIVTKQEADKYLKEQYPETNNDIKNEVLVYNWEDIINNSKFKELYNYIKPFVKKDIKIYEADLNSQGRYTNGNIYINKDAKIDKAQILLHELVHSITLDSLKNNESNYYKEISDLYNKYIRPLTKTSAYGEVIGDFHGVKNIFEFVAEAFTNKEFQEKLNSIQTNNNKSVWQKLLDIFRNLIGIPINKSSVLNEVINITNNYLNSNQITPQQKQQAQQLYSSYLQTTNNPTIEGFKQWNNKQQQVNKLFESNPELANEVYEALGFSQKIDLSEKNIFTVEPIQSVDKKAKSKAKIATQYIGFAEGIAGSSTALYAKQISEQNNKFKIPISKTLNKFLEPFFNSNDESIVEPLAKNLTNEDKQILAKSIGRSYKDINQFDWYEDIWSDVGKEEVYYYLKTGNNLEQDIQKEKVNSKLYNEWQNFIKENKDFVDDFYKLPKEIQKEQKKDFDKLKEKNDWYVFELSNLEYGIRENLLKQEGYLENKINITSNIVNSGNYSPNDVIFVSIGDKRGNEAIRKAQQDRTIREAIKALDAGATLITDNAAYVESNSYNEGEKRLAASLKDKGYFYSETTVDGNVLGVWNKNTNQITPQQKQLATKENPIQIYADGSDIKGTGQIGFGVYFEFNGKKFEYSGIANKKDFGDKYNISEQELINAVSNPTMELMAAVEALEQFKDTAEHIEIINDYEGVKAWITGTWKAKKSYIQDLVTRARNLITQIEKNGGSVKITTLKEHAGVKSHSGHWGNDNADRLAKSREIINNFNSLYGENYKTENTYENYINLLKSKNKDSELTKEEFESLSEEMKETLIYQAKYC